jgi:hypothetical protein
MFTICAYCNANPPIKNSHILPKWTIRLALEESVTGKLRPTDDINRRLQDAEKLPLLCLVCENQFSKLEGEAKKQFLGGGINHDGAYNADFFRFLVTIIWRVATVRTDQVKAEAPHFSAALANAVQTWDQFLRGSRSDVGPYPIWFDILDADLAVKVDGFMTSISNDGRGAAPAINRYFANWLGCEVVTYDQEGFAIIWAKTSSWIIVGVVEVRDKRNYSSIELAPGGGTFPSRNHLLPPIVLATLGHQSWNFMRASAEMKPSQRKKIQESWKQNAAKIAGSRQNRAMREDLALFGKNAWVDLPNPEDHS